ncbi:MULTISPECIES: GntR family transcriptional regulator [unclassified Bordetella]|uniref:GntR family transcriptional regulator n=1 Tax=unclassified Bordetella TaxID=2630031 RepID=UPI001366577A|nr:MULTISPECIES: GntR family transcriptional regulator [unclassified Bordetella]
MTSPHSTPERIRLKLQSEIESGTLRAGEVIDEKAMAAKYGVSRTPIREALLMLAAQKLVVTVPRAGSMVYKPSAIELIALLEYLGELEGVAARLAALRMTAEQRSHLMQIHQSSESLAQLGERHRYEEANRALHEHIYHCSGNLVINEEIVHAQRRLSNFRRHVFNQPGRLRASFAEHTALVNALVAGDGDMAASAMREHIIGKGKAFADLVLVNA